jgi:hypothetical protein
MCATCNFIFHASSHILCATRHVVFYVCPRIPSYSMRYISSHILRVPMCSLIFVHRRKSVLRTSRLTYQTNGCNVTLVCSSSFPVFLKDVCLHQQQE